MNLKISQIVPDENQPRRYFDPEKLATLQKSIKRFGIRVPLVVEQIGGNKFRIVDGERRFRMAKELGIQEVPVTISYTASDTERLLEQFHIQNQRADWTAAEKASVVSQVAELGGTMEEIAEQMGITPSALRIYKQYYEILDKKTWEKNNIDIKWATNIASIRRIARDQFAKNGETLDRDKEKALEAAKHWKQQLCEELYLVRYKQNMI